MHVFKRSARIQYFNLVFFVLVLILVSSSFAQEKSSDSFKLETITVTAEKQEDDVQKVPSAITVFTEGDLEDADIEEIGEVIKQVPNMTFGKTFLGDEAVFRGIRNSQFTNKNPVVIYIDGIPHDNVANFDADLNNVERVEVLRGPQGALYGKNSIGGIINVITNKPDNNFNAKCTTEFGENDTYGAKAYVEGPIVKDTLFFGVTGSWNETQGFMKNNYPGEDNFDGDQAIRTKALFKWVPTDRMKVNFHAGASRTSRNNGALIRSDEVRYYDFRDPEDKIETDILNFGLNLVYEWDEIEFTSVSTFSDNERILRQNLNYYRSKPTWIGLGTIENSMFTQEFRFQSNNNNKSLKWLGGIYYSKDKEDLIESGSIMNTEATLGFNKKIDYPGALDEEAVSAFGQVTVPVGSRFDFTAGLRYEYIQKQLNHRYTETRVDTGEILKQGAYDIDEDWGAFLPKGVLSWKINEDAMIYASVAKGYLAGGLHAYETDKESAKFDEQTSIDYEIGTKTSWLDDRLFLNATLFYMDIKDMHVYSMTEFYIFVASNAGAAHSKGIEIEAKARPVKGVDLTAQLGWIDAEYDDYNNYTGNRIQRTPEYTLNLAAQYRHASGFFVRGEMQGNGKTYYDDANTDSQKSYEIFNIKAGYESSGWALSVYCKNIFDKEYFSYGRSCGIGTIKEVGNPRTIGLIASISF
ncbi:TonB-dependent receptor [Desulfobacula toluolica]|uniref:TonB-dependent receptor n=1 Tax=Desulfobacula toluolica (strain DSM 7467 / Tol2) TaxID=651182 RepID=K0NL87_DESTT|nr:TonB-dependent receptor [Desulfobacula toluolica]CCK82341.1 TonB-dependent receptor [Desulfobacula toluolica Tol2]